MTFFKALTAIDLVTNLLKIIWINDKSSQHVLQQFSNCWLSTTRYPWPTRVVHDNGGEFIGWEFQGLLRQPGIQSILTTVKNPQSNTIIERIHQTMGDIPRVMMHINPPNDANQIVVDNALGTCVHSLWCTVNYAMQTFPGALLVFQRHVVMNVLLIANIYSIQ